VSSIGQIVRPLQMLLVEDNPADVRLALEALEHEKFRNVISVVTDGEEALAFLRREGGFVAAPRPDLVLLDLNLPKKDGREVLAEMKRDVNLRSIPVAVLTSSEDDEDVFRAYELGANCYITKPVDLEEFLKVVRAVQDFWVTIVKLPGDSGDG